MTSHLSLSCFNARHWFLREANELIRKAEKPDDSMEPEKKLEDKMQAKEPVDELGAQRAASKASSKAPRERVSMLPVQAIQGWFSPFRQPAAVIHEASILVPGSFEASESHS